MLLTLGIIAGAVIIVAFVRGTRAGGMYRVDACKGDIGGPEADRQVLAAFRDAGGDVDKPTEVNFYLYFPTRDAAERAAASAGTPQMPAYVDRGADGKSWLCFVSGQMVPSEAAIRAASVRLQAIAAAHGGEYDGWEAAVTW